jgi:hypothetical protein
MPTLATSRPPRGAGGRCARHTPSIVGERRLIPAGPHLPTLVGGDEQAESRSRTSSFTKNGFPSVRYTTKRISSGVAPARAADAATAPSSSAPAGARRHVRGVGRQPARRASTSGRPVRIIPTRAVWSSSRVSANDDGRPNARPRAETPSGRGHDARGTNANAMQLAAEPPARAPRQRHRGQGAGRTDRLKIGIAAEELGVRRVRERPP